MRTHHQVDNDNDSDEPQQFRRKYSKALAEALRENDESVQPHNNNNHHKSKRERALHAYRALCHDDPRVDSDASLQALCESLLLLKTTNPTAPEDPTLALSERLVDGLLQATHRVEGANPAAGSSLEPTAAVEDQPDKKDSTAPSSLLFLSESSLATASGYAMLATTVFVQIPLLCIETTDLSRIQRYLGSYVGPERPRPPLLDGTEEYVDEKQRGTDDSHIRAITESLNRMNGHDAAPTSPDDDDDDDEPNDYFSLHEVWAAESDASDFEYESGYDPQVAIQVLDHWPSDSSSSFLFDPVKLSTPPTDAPLTWKRARRALMNLVSELQYSKLGGLSSSQWKATNVSDLLTQLTLLLLVQPSLLLLQSNSENQDEEEELQSMRQLGTRPLFVLRDRAAAHHNVWSEYLTLLQSLISVHAAGQSTTKRATGGGDVMIAPATQVGLSCLSALCQAEATSINIGLDPRRLRQCVLETCEDLANLLEEGSPETMRLILVVLPMLDRLTNVKSDGTIFAPALSGGVSKADAQLFLSSGLFRSLVLSYARSDDESSASTTFARKHMLQCILVLSIQSPTLLGKYAWRVPELSQCIHAPSVVEENEVDGLLWSLLGTTLARGTTARLNILKTGGIPDAPVPTAERCRELCLDRFQTVGQHVLEALDEIHKVRTKDSSGTTLDQLSKDIIHDFARLTNYLISCPNLASLWDDVVSTTPENKAIIESLLLKVRSALAELPHVVPTVSSPSNTEKTADNDKRGKPIPRATPQFEEEERAVRKSLKILGLSLQSGSGRGTTNFILSSKTD